MDCLPYDMIFPILSCLDVDDICRCGCVSKTWASALHYDPIASKVTTQKPMAIAGKLGNKQITALLSEGLDATSDEMLWKSYNCLHFAALNGSSELVDALLDNGAPVDGLTSRGESPLHLAAMKGHHAVVKRLIARGCTIDPRDCNMKTPLMLAAHQGHTGILIELACYGADVNARDICNNTALILAAWNGKSSIVETLISTGANINIAGQSGKTALQRSTELRHNGVSRILSLAGATPGALIEDASSQMVQNAEDSLQRVVRDTLMSLAKLLHLRVTATRGVLQ